MLLCLLMLLLLAQGLDPLFAQENLGDLGVELLPEGEGLAVVVRNPSEAVLIVRSSLEVLFFESSNQIYRVEYPDPGVYYLHLIPGTHKLLLKADGYRPSEIQLNLPAKSSRQIEVWILKEPSGNGELWIRTIPKGATITLNGLLVGKRTGAHFSDQPAGDYHIHLGTGPYYFPVDTMVTIRPNEEVYLNILLERTNLNWARRRDISKKLGYYIPGAAPAAHGMWIDAVVQFAAIGAAAYVMINPREFVDTEDQRPFVAPDTPRPESDIKRDMVFTQFFIGGIAAAYYYFYIRRAAEFLSKSDTPPVMLDAWNPSLKK